MDKKRRKLSSGKNEIEIQCQEEEMTVLRQKVINIEAELKLNEIEIQCQEEEMTVLSQKVINIEAELKLKNEEKGHLVERVVSLEQELAQKVTSLEQQLAEKEAQLKLKIKEKDHLIKRVTSLEQELVQKITSLEKELAEKGTQLKLKDEEQEQLVECVTSLEQELAVKETQLKLRNEEHERLEKRVTSLENELKNKETQLQLRNEKHERLEKRVTSLENELKNKETQLQLIKEPFDAVPNEVVVEIFKHLTQNELGKIAGVCQRWNKLTRSPVLWQNVNVEFRISHNDAFVPFINRLSCSPTSITVQFPFITDRIQPLEFQELCVALQRKCPDLQQLIWRRPKLTTSLPSVLNLCSQFLPELTSFFLLFPKFLNYSGKVQSAHTSKIAILDVTGSHIEQFRRSIFSRMPCLKELYLSSTSTYINDSWCSEGISFSNQIEVLNLGYSINIGYIAFREIKNCGLNLKEIYMCGTHLDDEDLSFDTSAFPRLEIICLNNCHYVTCDGVVSLVRSCPFLQDIYVNNEVTLSYARHSFVIANPCKLGIVKIIKCSKHNKK